MNNKPYRNVPGKIFKISVIAAILAGGANSVFAQAPAPEKKPGWDTSAALGLTLTKGNSDTLLFTGNIATGKKWDGNELAFGADVTYGESEVTVDVPNPTPPPATVEKTKREKNAEALHAFGQYNRLISERAFGYIRLDALHDDVADLDYRLTLSPGAGYYFIKNEATQLSGEVGPGFIYEKQGGETTGYVTLRLAERLDHKLNDRAKIWQRVEILPQVDDFDNYIVNSELGIESSLTKKLSLRAFIQDTYDNEPAPGRKKNDLKLVTSLAYKF